MRGEKSRRERGQEKKCVSRKESDQLCPLLLACQVRDEGEEWINTKLNVNNFVYFI